MNFDEEWYKEFIEELERRTDRVTPMEERTNNTICTITAHNGLFIFWIFIDNATENKIFASVRVYKRVNGDWEEFVGILHKMTLSPDREGAIKAFKFMLSISG